MTEHSTTENECKNQEFHPLMLDKFLDLCADVDTKGDYSFTGVWHSAKGLLHFLLADQVQLHGNILELGAGTGWLGITLAQHVDDTCQKIVLSDRQGNWLQANLDAAQNQGLSCHRVSCLGMDWKRKANVQYVADMGWNWIIGSDLIYSEQGIKDLAGAMAILAKSGTTTPPPKIIYAHTMGRMPELDEQWEKELQTKGLAWKVLAVVPVLSSEKKVWEGRSTVIMDIYQSA